MNEAIRSFKQWSSTWMPMTLMAHAVLGVALLAVVGMMRPCAKFKRGSELAPESYYESVCSGIVLGYCGELRIH